MPPFCSFWDKCVGDMLFIIEGLEGKVKSMASNGHISDSVTKAAICVIPLVADCASLYIMDRFLLWLKPSIQDNTSEWRR